MASISFNIYEVIARLEEQVVWRIDGSELFMKSHKQEENERRENVHPGLGGT